MIYFTNVTHSCQKIEQLGNIVNDLVPEKGMENRSRRDVSLLFAKKTIQDF